MLKLSIRSPKLSVYFLFASFSKKFSRVNQKQKLLNKIFYWWQSYPNSEVYSYQLSPDSSLSPCLWQLVLFPVLRPSFACRKHHYYSYRAYYCLPLHLSSDLHWHLFTKTSINFLNHFPYTNEDIYSPVSKEMLWIQFLSNKECRNWNRPQKSSVQPKKQAQKAEVTGPQLAACIKISLLTNLRNDVRDAFSSHEINCN